jgi:hypothetical protein
MAPAGVARVVKVTVALKITLAFRIGLFVDVTASARHVPPWGRPPFGLLFATTSPLHVR